MKYSSSDLNYVGKCLALKRPSDGKQFLLLFGSDEVSFYVTFIFERSEDNPIKNSIWKTNKISHISCWFIATELKFIIKNILQLNFFWHLQKNARRFLTVQRGHSNNTWHFFLHFSDPPPPWSVTFFLNDFKAKRLYPEDMRWSVKKNIYLK